MLYALPIPLSCAKCTAQLLDYITVIILGNGAKCQVSYVIFITYRVIQEESALLWEIIV